MTISTNSYLTRPQQKENAEYIYSYLSKYFTKESICAMLGNGERESTNNFGLWQDMLSGNIYGGLGWLQWTPATKIINFAESKGMKGTDPKAQLDYVIDNLLNGGEWISTSKYPMSFKEFSKSTKSPDYLASVFLANYERAGVSAEQERRDNAMYWYKTLDGKGGSGGLQLAVLPIDVIWVTQSEFTPNFSHEGTNAVDMVGTHTRYPLQAPFDCVCKGVDRSEAAVVWQSINKVKCVDGDETFVTFNILHDDTHYKINVGDTKNKGELIGYTGNSGHSFGDHLHIEASKSEFTSVWSGGGLPNSNKLWDIFSSCDNVNKKRFKVYDSGGIPWRCSLNYEDGEGVSNSDKENINEKIFWQLESLKRLI